MQSAKDSCHIGMVLSDMKNRIANKNHFRPRLILSVILLAMSLLAVPCAGEGGSFGSCAFSDLKNNTGNSLEEYSGKNIIWHGKLKKLVSNEAYFEYRFVLDSGDEITVLSGRGLGFEPGENLQITGFIMIKNGRFSHVVVEKAEKAPVDKNFRDENTFTLLKLSGADRKKIYNRILSWILYYNRGITRKNAQFIANRIVHYSAKYDTDPFLVTALISAESAFNIRAVSVAGAIGLGQLMPGTASLLGVNAYNPDENIEGSVIYLSRQLEKWKNSKNRISLALASYNAGPGAVARYGGIPPYRETIDYVAIVNYLYKKIRSEP